nr:fimbrillin family protein [Parabacteroides goldsteinii]
MIRIIPPFPLSVVAASLLIAAATLAGCSQNNLPGTDYNDIRPGAALTVQVADGGYSPAEGTRTDTRATENGYKTEFTAGDRIGLYAVKNNAVVAECANLCLTLTADASAGGKLSWTPPAGTGVFYEGDGATYYAYYPYQADAVMNGNVDASATTAGDFFKTLVANWTPATDQSTYALYTAQDLMTGSGKLNDDASARTLTIALSHCMALAVIETPGTKYTFTNGSPSVSDYTVSTVTFNDFTPCAMAVGSHRYLVRPATKPLLLGSYTNADGNTQEFTFTPTIDAGEYKKYTVDGGSATFIEITHKLQAGDFYMKDGTLVGKDETLSDAQKANCLGVVFYVADITQDDPLLKKDHSGCTHGLVVALQDAGGRSFLWSTAQEDITTEWLSKQAGNAYGIATLKTENKRQGYANTKALAAYNASERTSGNKSDFKVLSIDIITQYASGHPAPTNSSGWYWPSIMELKFVCWGQNNGSGVAGKNMLNEQFRKVPGARSLKDRYFSSTEYDEHNAWYVNSSSGNVDDDYKGNNHSVVRAVLAF